MAQYVRVRVSARLIGGMGRRSAASIAILAILLSMLHGMAGALGWSPWATDGLAPLEAAEGAGSLLISEVVTGGAGASDEIIELYNPTSAELPLEGLEVVYVSSSGATVTRKATWAAGAPVVPPGAHVLLANEAGAYASVADLTYAGGMAAAGGSVAIRIVGASSAVDAVGWGTAASTWLEGTPVPAPAAGRSVERLPGGAAGSGQDVGNNAVDFVEREVPDPQNSGSDPIDLSAGTPTPAPSPTLGPTVSPTPSPSPSPTLILSPTPSPTPWPTPPPGMTSIAQARAMPDGAEATIEGVTLTHGAFTDGGGYVADSTGGIAVLVDGGAFPRGVSVRVTGELDDRYHQRTLRAAAADVIVLGAAQDPVPAPIATGLIGEELEGALVRVSGELTSAATQLSSAVSFDIDDGSGPARLVIHATTGVETAAWSRGTALEVVGVVGQRDSGGTGAAGYRLQPRDVADIVAVATAPSPTPSATGSGGSSPTPGASPSPGAAVSIALARTVPVNTRVTVRGTVTLPSHVLGEGTAAIQDASGAIILRIGDEAGNVALGDELEVQGNRSTKSGMETIRVSTPPVRLGSGARPEPARRATGELGEDDEARLLVVRGAVTTAPRRSSAQNAYFDLDDGSGAARVFVAAGAQVDLSGIEEGSWVEVVGVLGQETSGQQPLRGYRLWPRTMADIRIVAPATEIPAGRQGDAVDGSGGVGAGAGSGSATGEPGSSEPALALPPPRLAGSTATHPPASRRSPLAVLREEAATADGPALPPLALLGAVVLLGGVGAVVSARPGLWRRLRETLDARRPAPAGETLGGPQPEAASALPANALETTAARLVPLSVLEGGGGDGRADAAARGTGRILPPT